MANKTTAKDKSTSRRMGRPPQPAETARRNRVVTMVTDSELKDLSLLADEEQQSLSAAVQQILARYLKGRKRRIQND